MDNAPMDSMNMHQDSRTEPTRGRASWRRTRTSFLRADFLRAATLVIASAALLVAACQPMGSASSAPSPETVDDEHLKPFGDFELPRKIGSVDNVGLQIPTVSPDGEQLLYLRSDRDDLALMSLLGSPDPLHTPPDGELAIWQRPVSGTLTGRRISPERWAHSPVWSDSGQAIVYVVNQPPGSYIVHLELTSGQRTPLGLGNAVNCLPRFGPDDDTVVFCAGPTPAAFRVFRQRVGEPEPTALTPPGGNYSLPLAASTTDQVWCTRADGSELTWIAARPDNAQTLVSLWGTADQPDLLQTWAGIANPLSPDGRSFLFYDAARNRIRAYHATDRRVVGHRLGSIAACWLGPETIALATADGVFLVDTASGRSPGLFNGSWIPCRYVPRTGQLLLLGRERVNRFSIVEVLFRPR